MTKTITECLKSVKNSIPESVKLIAVSKTKPNSDILEAYQEGHKYFGENKAQELERKAGELPGDIHWHFIGHLQTNKVKQIAPFVAMIEAVDSLKLLKEINKQAAKSERVIPCLLQFHIAEEDTKFGLDREEVQALLDSEPFKKMQNIRIAGVMGMATYTENSDQVRREFKFLKAVFDWLKQEYFSESPDFKEISMGMSGDYLIAVEEGATIIRVGSLIFGERNYN
ncbi:MAG: YggS family pyridoxal phosphate-dependent enzyme [Bacteroidetes bacterium]|jgi:pyridoxal phosphate enzyme (YggS family)|nr:YggS family pyridoxal phosphate-dependent enzyme [Bacteroidota bacterium]